MRVSRAHCTRCNRSVDLRDLKRGVCKQCRKNKNTQISLSSNLEREVNLKPTIVKTYQGQNEQEALREYQADVARMNAQGYFPISQSYQPGSYGCGVLILALILCFVLVGIIIIIFLLLVKPPGTLVVTYERREKIATPETKICPQCAEEVKVAARICRFCRFEF